MEQGRKMDKALGLYQQRLQNLPKIIAQLYEIVKSDEILKHLQDPTMEKYKIDRINEIMLEVLNSEKEKMLIRVLEKYEEVSRNAVVSKKEDPYFDRWSDLKQKYDKQVAKMSKVIDEKNQMINRINKDKESLKNKIEQKQKEALVLASKVAISAPIPEHCLKCEKLRKELTQVESERKIAGQLIQKLKRDGESAIEMLNTKIKVLTQKNEALQQELLRKSATLNHQQQLSTKNDNTKRNQKIEVMRRQIAFLEGELIQVQKQFNTMKDVAMGCVMAEIKKMKTGYKKFRDAVVAGLKGLEKENNAIVEEMGRKLLKECDKSSQNIKPQTVLWKLNSLENQLDYFLQNQVLAQ